MSFKDVYFFDLPVYRLSRDQYVRAEEKAIVAVLDRIEKQSGYPISEQVEQSMRFDRFNRYGEWRFNEVVAYIRLYFRNSQLMATYHTAEKKRNQISRSKVFTERTRSINYKRHLGSLSNTSNTEIWAIVQDFVEACRKIINSNRFIDDSTLQSIGPYMDWVSIWQQGYRGSDQ